MVERAAAVLDRTFTALAHPVRREMLDRLSSGPARVTDLASPFDISLQAASKHIRVLESAGLVLRTINGRDHVLALKPKRLADAAAWIEHHREFWEQRLDALERHLRKKGRR